MKKKTFLSENKISFLALIYFQLHLNQLSEKNISLAFEHLIKAIKLSPEIALFYEDLLVEWTSKLKNGNFILVVKEFLNSQEYKKLKLKISKPRVFGRLHISQGIFKYQHKQYKGVVIDIISGLFFYPKEIINYGLWIILLKSFILSFLKEKPRTNQNQIILTEIGKQLKELADITPKKFFPISGFASTSQEIIHHVITDESQEFILRICNNAQKSFSSRIKYNKLINQMNILTPQIISTGNYGNKKTQSYEWILEDKIPGDWFLPENFSSQQIQDILKDLAINLLKLHSITVTGFGDLEINDSALKTFSDWIEMQRNEILVGYLSGVIPESIAEQLDKASEFLKKSYTGPPKLCHSDLQPENLLVKNNRLSGIIDWESIKGNDPAYDIAVFFTAFAEWFPSYQDPMIQFFLNEYSHQNDTGIFLHRILAHQILIAAKLYIWIDDQKYSQNSDLNIEEIKSQLAYILHETRDISNLFFKT